ncbi:hypothetical protein [Microbacterium arborescens]|uniref:hypothetical protein n=1 Tax=Microbacterium arborescens TaxID=33883 RepID=UPI00277F856D|nr:hypothetical protein [Microbacterium arborescens]MDQ1215464.1 hypothetical protein [Microbacterium arborescens]
MVRTLIAAPPASATAKSRLAFADAALALAGHEVTDPALRTIVERAARHELTGDEARAAIRRHVQG